MEEEEALRQEKQVEEEEEQVGAPAGNDQIPTNIVDIEEAWKVLEANMDALIRFNEAEASHGRKAQLPSHIRSALYTLVYNLCTHEGGHAITDQLYKRYGIKVDRHCRENVAPRLRGLKGNTLLSALLQQWTLFQRLLHWFSAIFAYVDRHYTKLLQLLSLSEVGVNSFRLLVFDPVAEELCATILGAIREVRAGRKTLSDCSTQDQIAAAAQVFVEVGGAKLMFYQRDLEEHYLRDVRNSFKQAKERLLKQEGLSLGSPEYKEKCEQVVASEKAIAESLLHSSTAARLDTVAKSVLLR
ncbi:Cullin domain-containing protein [Balamuthia mandrillaris]